MHMKDKTVSSANATQNPKYLFRGQKEKQVAQCAGQVLEQTPRAVDMDVDVAKQQAWVLEQ